MKFGIHFHIPCYGAQNPVQRYRDTIEQTVHAEELGFDSVWPVEQHFNSALSITPAPLILLSALAERTRTMRLGIAVMLLPLWHPLRIAEEIACLDVLSNGRVDFGIGRGSIPSHFKGFGVSQTESRERFLEGLEIIRRAWTAERVSYRGRFYEIDGLSVVPKPVQRPYPPIRVASNSLESFEMMGRMGLDIFAATPVNPFPKLREYLPIYRNARRAAGHPDKLGDDVTLAFPLFVDESADQVRRLMEPSLTHYLEAVSANHAPDAAAPAEANSALQDRFRRFREMSYDRAREVMGIFDTPEVCADRLKWVEEEFKVNQVICWFNLGGGIPHDRVMRSMELFAAKVMPHLS